MARKSKATLEHEAAVKIAFPRVITPPVIRPNSLNNIYLLDLNRVSNITTRNSMENNKASLEKLDARGRAERVLGNEKSGVSNQKLSMRLLEQLNFDSHHRSTLTMK